MRHPTLVPRVQCPPQNLWCNLKIMPRKREVFFFFSDDTIKRLRRVNAFTTGNPFFYKFTWSWCREGLWGSKRGNAFTTENPYLGTNLLEVSTRIGRDFGALKGVNAFTTGNPYRVTNLLEVSIGRGSGALKGLRSTLTQKTIFSQKSATSVAWGTC